MNCKRGHSPWDHLILGIMVFLWRVCWLLENITIARPVDELRLTVEALRWEHRKLYGLCAAHDSDQR